MIFLTPVFCVVFFEVFFWEAEAILVAVVFAAVFVSVVFLEDAVLPFDLATVAALGGEPAFVFFELFAIPLVCIA